jgi:hypothetical protein
MRICATLYPKSQDRFIAFAARLPKANADSAAILINEFHAGGFEALSHNLKHCATGLMRAGPSWLAVVCG